MNGRRQRDPAELAARLRELADEIEAGRRRVPAPGRGIRRVRGFVVVPLVLHDVLCGWRVATPQDAAGVPDVLHCAGCGLAYLLPEVRAQVAQAATARPELAADGLAELPEGDGPGVTDD